jgi:aminoglycoside phosphotransferase (APT) family kinase protein
MRGTRAVIDSHLLPPRAAGRCAAVVGTLTRSTSPVEQPPARSQPHGFTLTAEEHRLLRGAPPPAALHWAAAAVGPGARVRSVRPLAGGTSAAVHALAVEDRAGQLHRLVLRRFVRANWLAEEPDLAEREAAALDLLRAGPLAAPRLVTVDARGEHADVPAVLMTRLPGRVEWNPPDRNAFLRRLAEPLPHIHALPVPAATPLPHYQPYALEMRRPPRWATQPEVWRRAIAILDGPAPAVAGCFIHRDYHPGNVLWTRGRVCGVIDWVNASIGVPEADVGHCRVNLADRFGQPAADRFLEIYQTISGRADYHPYWDIVAAIGGLDESADERPAPREEHFLANAVALLSVG